MQAEALRDSLPPSDKSLSRLLCEVPSLPQSVLKFLECLCSPGSCDKTEKDSHSGDRVTQGLSTVWNLILLRPPVRDVCLRIALKVTLLVLFSGKMFRFHFYLVWLCQTTPMDSQYFWHSLT